MGDFGSERWGPVLVGGSLGAGTPFFLLGGEAEWSLAESLD